MKNLLLVLICLSISSRVMAQKKWTLEECIETTLENSLDVRKSNIAVDYARINVTQSKHNRYPSLSASSGVNLRFGRSINPITNQFETQSFFSNSYGINSQVTLFNGFRLSNALRQAKNNTDVSKLDAEQVRRDLALTVANSFLNVLFATENLTLAKTQLQTTQQRFDRTKRLVKAGSQPENVLLDIEAQLASNEQSIINAENNKAVAILRLKQLMRIDPDTAFDIEVPEIDDPLTDPDALTVKELFKQSVQNEPRLQAAQLRMKTAELGVDIAKAGLYPSIGLGGSLSTNYSNRSIPGIKSGYLDQLDNNLGYGVGVNMRIPIYENYRNKLSVERAKLNVLEVANQAVTVEDNLKVTVQKALTDARLSKRKRLAAQKNVKAQEAALENSRKRFDMGLINTFEFNSIQNNVTQAKVNALIAKYEYMLAMKIIDFYTGKPITLK